MCKPAGCELKNIDGGGGLLNNWNAMCTTCAADPSTGTGMVVYDTGPAGATYGSNSTGGFDISTIVNKLKPGSVPTGLQPDVLKNATRRSS